MAARTKWIALATAALATAAGGSALEAQGRGAQTAPRGLLAQAVAAPTRTPANVARDRYRHPAETLAFFGVRPEHRVLEVIPGGGGWYTEILAPYLAARGTYLAAQPAGRGQDALRAKLAAAPATYGKAKLVAFPLADAEVAPGSVDRVLTFRNVHNFVMAEPGTAERHFAAMFRALKPGGVLGVVDHRLPEDRPVALERSSGYLKRSTVVRLAQGAGFRLDGESQVNANPRDTADHPEGVWTLPPVLRLGDKDREKYLAIGESDRMTLRFVKPRS